ncbi:MAG: hypothetical protein U9N02_01535 [Campylobacterota bacterium]|nr:hypothetical protein [Campylobacterota bacterium]
MIKKDIKNYEEILQAIYKNKKFIIKNYNSKKNQILIDKPLIHALLTLLKASYYDKFDKTQVIKFIIKDVLKLKDNDLIMIKKGSIFIKLFDETKRRQVSKKERNTEVNRFNGFDEDELKSFYTEYFANDELNILFDTTAKIFVQKYFIDSKINNEEYEKNVFGLVQKIIYQQLIEEFDGDNSFYRGFSGYIFRQHFKLLFEFLSIYILREAINSNKCVLDFLQYYSKDIIISNGKKFLVPSLETKDEQRWHPVSMISKIKPYLKAQEHVDEIEININKLDKLIEPLYKDQLSPIEYNLQNIKESEKLEKDVALNTQEMEKIYDQLHILQDQEKDEEIEIDKLNKELKIIRDERIEFKNLKFKIRRKRIQKPVIDNYEKLLNQRKKFENDIRIRSRVIKLNQTAFESAIEALSQALMSKKQIYKSPVI